MMHARIKPAMAVEDSLEAIEATVLPSLAMLLDSAMDAARGAFPGVDAELHAAELRAVARQVEELTALLACSLPAAIEDDRAAA